MSTYNKAEASQPQKKMHECTRCKSAGFPNQMIWFKKVENGYDDKIFWKLMDDSGLEHIHKYKTSPMVNNEVSEQKIQRIKEPFPNGESYEQVADRMKSFLDWLRKNFEGKTVLIIGHRATHYGLDHWIAGKPLKECVTEEFTWQPGWKYELK